MGYTLREYNSNGDALIYFYNTDGSLTNIQKNELDNNGNVKRFTQFNSNGQVKSFHDKTYDDLGREKRNTIYNPDGTVHEVHITKYKPNSYHQWRNAEYYRYDSKGNLIM